jgi:hypothetical protein
VVSGPGGRNGMKRPGPSDQVGIDGSGASSSSGHWTGAETLGRAGGARGRTWGLSPATRTGCGGAGHSGDLNEGRHGRIWTPGRILRVRDGVGRNRCSTRTTLRCSWIKVEGRVRSRGTSRVHAYRDRGKRGSRATAKSSSSLHSKTRVSSFFSPAAEQGTVSGV